MTFQKNQPVTATSSTIAVPPQESKGRKVHPRPVSISASGSSKLHDFERLEKPKRKDLSARQAIFDSGGVGVDLRTAARTGADPTKPTTFMKPAGVDVPKDVQIAPAALASNSDNIINGARSEQKKREREREHDVTAGEPEDMSTKPKKRKKKKNSE